jgi:hypothetical protein
MAGDWIKVEHATPDKLEVVQMSSILRIDQDAVAGKLVRVWSWADENSVDGAALTVTEAFIDKVARRKGFAAAMREAGWLRGKNGALELPNFQRHNGKSAKKRAVDMERKRREREESPPERDSGPNPVLDPSTKDPPGSVTKSGQKTDKSVTRERERDITPKVPLPGDELTAIQALQVAYTRLRRLWRKHESTPFDRSEGTAWEKGKLVVAATTEEQWQLLEWWRHADPKEFPDVKYRRGSLATHVNNWNAEISRAAEAAAKCGVNFEKKRNGALVAGVDYPEDWQTYFDPEINLPKRFEELPESGRQMVLGMWRSQ